MTQEYATLRRLRTADRMECAGALLMFVGGLSLVGTVMALFEFGRWTQVVTVFVAVSLGILGVGVVLSTIGYRRQDRIRRLLWPER